MPRSTRFVALFLLLLAFGSPAYGRLKPGTRLHGPPPPPAAPAPPPAPVVPSASVVPVALGSQDSASTFSLINDRIPLAAVDGQWRFQPGDDPHWSDPGLDDSHWALVSAKDDWREIGYGGLTGLAWYRFRVTLPAGEEGYALRLPQIYTCFQVFANGALLLTQGEMPPNPVVYETRPSVVDISTDDRPTPQTIVVALRVWQAPEWRRYHPGGPHGVTTVGRSDIIHAQFDTETQAHAWQYSDEIDLGALDLLAFVISIALFLSRRAEREFLWFSLVVLGLAGQHLFDAWGALHITRIQLVKGIQGSFTLLFLIASLLFYRSFLEGKRTRAFKFVLICSGVVLLAHLLLLQGFFSATATNIVALIFDFPIYVWIVLLVRRRARQRRSDARLLATPVTLLFLSFLYSQFISTLETAGLGFATHLEIKMRRPFYLTLDDVAEGIFLIAMLAILLRRFSRSRREQDRIESELEAARSVQKVLVPESLPQVAGLSIATAYHPAEEVGGDFFQIVPLRSGDTLLVVGDVAGKGLPAALTVSLVVGTLRALADYTESPSDVLAGLNRRLYGRGPGFTTCVALRFSADRTVLTISNAGHPAPYINGYELRPDENLPLGLDPDADFVETRYGLSAGDHVTVLTDGVPEAMHGRELFGFERTGMLSRESASHIAEAARSFGQSDDITVLTVDVVSVSAGQLEEFQPVLQPA